MFTRSHIVYADSALNTIILLTYYVFIFLFYLMIALVFSSIFNQRIPLPVSSFSCEQENR